MSSLTKTEDNKCERCRSFHKSIHAEGGWYCNRYLKWICKDSLANDKRRSYFKESKRRN